MSASVILMAFGAFLAGGAISFRRQGFPLWAVALLAAASAAVIGYGVWSWFQGLPG